jgi:hypothetical protein
MAKYLNWYLRNQILLAKGKDWIIKYSANYIVGLFNEKVTPIKEAHEWIYNPPLWGNGEINTRQWRKTR